MGNIVYTLTNRRYLEKCIAYAESHDQVNEYVYKLYKLNVSLSMFINGSNTNLSKCKFLQFNAVNIIYSYLYMKTAYTWKTF